MKSDIIKTNSDVLARRSDRFHYDISTRSVIFVRYNKKTGRYEEVRKLLPNWICSLIAEEKSLALDKMRRAVSSAAESSIRSGK